MPELKEITLTDFNPVLLHSNFKPVEYTFREYPGMAIKKVDRSTFWVYDTSANKGVITPGYYEALELLENLASLEF